MDNQNNQYIADNVPSMTTLYESSPDGGFPSGSQTLSQSIQNFNIIRIYFRSAYDYCQSSADMRVVSGSGAVNRVALVTSWSIATGEGNLKVATVTFNGNAVSFQGSSEISYPGGTVSSGALVYITKIVGIR